jgi:glycosyltransferase involved in cell wall biosynthesis
MKILHLYSNHKWTGPADHALNLCAWLDQLEGVSSHLACGWRRDRQNTMRGRADRRHIKQVRAFHLAKHLNWRVLPDALRLRRLWRSGEFDLVHSHLDNDMLAAVMAGWAPQLVRTVYAGEPWDLDWRQRTCLSRAAVVLTASRRVRDDLAGRYPDKCVHHIQVPVDLARFAPRPKQSRLLATFRISADQPVAGIVARVQRHRRFDLLLQSLREVATEIPDMKFLIIGRGTHIDEIARKPAIQMGLEDHVVFTGYRTEDFTDVLNLLDFKVFLVPGSDGACRAAREALACGKPVVATRRGILPEIISDGENGLLIDEAPESLAGAMIGLWKDRSRLERLAGKARAHAEKKFSPVEYTSAVAACYQRLLQEAGRTFNAPIREVK